MLTWSAGSPPGGRDPDLPHGDGHAPAAVAGPVRAHVDGGLGLGLLPEEGRPPGPLARGIDGDLDENLVRDLGLGLGFVDVKVAAVDETWSALKFVRRLADR